MPLPPPPLRLRLPGRPAPTGGGQTKIVPADFVVDEVPAYPPSGTGEFLLLHVEKEDVSGSELVRRVARRLGISRGDIGVAGIKDRRAITRQWISVPARDVADPAAIDGAVGDSGRITLLATGRHDNKLRTGHLKGNRFEIRVYGRDPGLDAAAAASLESAAVDGMPNVFGAQRFGDGDTPEIGLRVLAGDRSVRDKRMRRLGISAVQSWVFNTWLEARLAHGTIHQALAGDVLQKRPSGGKFTCDDPETDTARIAAGELVVTGPIPGKKVRGATGVPGELEADALAASGVALADFARVGRLALGARRAALAWPGATSCEREGDALVLRFTLPRGCYATVLLEAVCGPDLVIGTRGAARGRA